MTNRMKCLAAILFFAGLTGGFAQTPLKDASTTGRIIGVPLTVEKISENLIFNASLNGEAAPIEQIARPSDTPLRVVVVDLRDEGDTEKISPEDIGRLDARLPTRATWIRLGSPGGGSADNRGGRRAFPDWVIETEPNAEAAFERAESIFAADGTAAGSAAEREALLIINQAPENSPAALDNPVTAHAAGRSPRSAGRLTTLLTAGGAANDAERRLKAEIRNWWRSLRNFYLIRIRIGANQPTGVRLSAEARLKNKIVGSQIIEIDFSGTAAAAATAAPADEVEEALLDYAKIVSFERMNKFPGLPAADIDFFRAHYAPGIEGVVIEDDPPRVERLSKAGAVVFRLHKVDRQCETLLLRSELATVFTWKLTFVSLTTKTLDVLSDEELIALIAHEVGHLYFAADLRRARELPDDRLARVTELKCDLVALATLRRLKLKETNLIAAIEKLLAARKAINVAAQPPSSPFLTDRRRLAREFTARAND